MMAVLARRFVSNPPVTREQRQVDAWIDAQIAARRAAPRTDARDDILDLLLRSRYADGTPMSDASIRAEIQMLLVAGHTTTADSLASAFPLILRHPEVRAQIEAEVAAAGGDYTGATGFEFLDATIKEVIRLCPIVPLVFRRLATPLTIRGRSLPAGVTLATCIHLAHRRPETYPDPDRFRPERFLGRAVDRYSWVPFGGGFRRCLGANFALFEMRVLIATMLATSRIELTRPSSSDPAQQKSRFMRAPSEELKVIFGRRVPLPSAR
jgi:cytochrome P450